MPRKKPFSGKQKKEQLKLKREGKREDVVQTTAGTSKSLADEAVVGPAVREPALMKKDRYKLIFSAETKEEIAERKQLSMQPYQCRSEQELEVSINKFYEPPINFPTRPPWSYKLSLEQLQRQETEYFNDFCENYWRHENIGYCELNLETWRQLWRVLEMADIALIIVDIRFAPLHFNPLLYKYIREILHKPVVLVLNKCDMVPGEVAIAWKHYLLSEYSDLEIVMFTSHPKDDTERNALAKGKQSKRKRKRSAPVGPLDLWHACHKLVGGCINIDSWKHKIEEDSRLVSDVYDADNSDTEVEHVVEATDQDLSFYNHQKFKDDTLTIGCVGYPNVGKSSVINGLMGHKVVSISRTPGHTKHFQTIYLTHNVRLCDCPGLVFPSRAEKSLQVLAGLYPISQLREPYSTVQFLAEFSNLPSILGLRLPEDEDSWTSYVICDEFAELKGFRTAKGARNDPFRAANWILRSALEGKVLFYLRPPDFHHKQDYWRNHTESRTLVQTQLDRLSVNQAERAEKLTNTHQVTEAATNISTSDSSEDESTATSNPFDVLQQDI